MSAATATKASGRTPFKKWCDENVGLFFLIPWIIGFLVFKVYPFASSLFYSFTDMNFFKGIHQYGIMNYVEIFTDKATTTSLLITFKYAFITVPLKLVFALFIAYILNFKIKFVNLFRTIYYIPSILGGSVAIAVLWRALFRDDGVINTLLGYMGIQGPSWLADRSWALFIICLLRVWQFGSAMVLFLAALKGVSADLYEAATIDGAGPMRILVSIILPAIRAAMIVVALFLFITLWNDLLQQTTYIDNPDKYTIAIGLSMFRSGLKADWAKIMCATCMAFVPGVLIYLVGQRYFVEGIVMTGMKN